MGATVIFFLIGPLNGLPDWYVSWSGVEDELPSTLVTLRQGKASGGRGEPEKFDGRESEREGGRDVILYSDGCS